ncbi:MAG: biotin synthase BioB [Bacteroidia bacterium]|nr:biotin synthase BioB [Bacteroidia bacterium]
MSENQKEWSFAEIQAIYHQPILDLVFQAATVHRQYNNPNQIQVCTLVSIKTGGCTEDCAYCSQSVKYQTDIEVHKLMDVETVLTLADEAKQNGSTRLCLGAAWRELRDNKDFDKILDIISKVKERGLEVCCTLGMLTEEQAKRLQEAGLDAYNHNLDTSPEYYSEIITTRTYEDRLRTLENVQKAGISLCCGGIIGLGESDSDRIRMLQILANRNPYPDSVPVNALVPVSGTPLENQPRVQIWDILRMVATARIIMPAAKVRLSAGRATMSTVEQAICFLAGANSIFAGEKLLTTPNKSQIEDQELFQLLGLEPLPQLIETHSH